MYFQPLYLTAITYLTIFPFAQSLYAGPSSSIIGSAAKPLSLLRSNSSSRFALGDVWQLPDPPAWLRPIEPNNVILLLDALAGIYSSRPPDELAGYTTLGPESSAAFANFSTRLIVKPWTVPSASFRECPKAPMRNKEIVNAADILRRIYRRMDPGETEWGYLMLYVDTGHRYISNCTGVFLVQRDLWWEGAEREPDATPLAETS
ncbi:hypothetical protein G7Y79_00042g078480 [Physcia stellaris]|nr:hypothetical protein G7Y79_00042g078480 [Physcia stellaris]